MQLRKNESQKDIGEQYNVSSSTVGRVIDSLEDNFTPVKDWLPHTIAFDDFKSGRFATSGMSMLLMNPVNHRTIDIIPSRNARSFRQYFYVHFTRQARLAVRLVVVDLYQPYRLLIHELFPYARIIADHFHVVVQAYRALQSLRIKVMNSYGPGTHEYHALKHFWKLLLQKLSDLDNVHYYPRRNFRGAWLTNSEVIDRLLSMSDELKTAYDYYQTIVDVIDHERSDELQNLLKRKLTSLPQSLQKVQRTLRHHQAEIIRSFKYHLSNGPIEGTNNKIKVIKRTAYGFRNFFRFRVRILIALKNSHLMVINPKKKTSSSKLIAWTGQKLIISTDWHWTNIPIKISQGWGKPKPWLIFLRQSLQNVLLDCIAGWMATIPLMMQLIIKVMKVGWHHGTGKEQGKRC